jgi:DNA repair exonuclease SbcCD ATPase subunit
MAQREQIDDLLDARAELRRLRIELTEKRVTLHKSPAYQAFKRVKQELAAIGDQFEEVLTEIEQKQGRLPFMAESDGPAIPVITNGKARPKRKSSAEGPRA